MIRSDGWIRNVQRVLCSIVTAIRLPTVGWSVALDVAEGERWDPLSAASTRFAVRWRDAGCILYIPDFCALYCLSLAAITADYENVTPYNMVTILPRMLVPILIMLARFEVWAGGVKLQSMELRVGCSERKTKCCGMELQSEW